MLGLREGRRKKGVREDYEGGLGSGMWAAFEEEECIRQRVNIAGSWKNTHRHIITQLLRGTEALGI